MFSQLRQKVKIRARGYCYDNGPQSERRRKAVDKRERVIAGACDEGTNEIFQYGDIYCIVRIDCLSCVFDHIFKQTF